METVYDKNSIYYIHRDREVKLWKLTCCGCVLPGGNNSTSKHWSLPMGFARPRDQETTTRCSDSCRPFRPLRGSRPPQIRHCWGNRRRHRSSGSFIKLVAIIQTTVQLVVTTVKQYIWTFKRMLWASYKSFVSISSLFESVCAWISCVD